MAGPEQRRFPFEESTPGLTTEISIKTKGQKRKRIPLTISKKEELATREWLGQSQFASVFARGAEAWRASQAVFNAEAAGINVEFGSGRGSLDDAEFVLRRAYQKALGTPVRSIDIVLQIKNEAVAIKDKLGQPSSWIGNYADWNIDLLGGIWRLNNTSVKTLKTYVHSFL